MKTKLTLLLKTLGVIVLLSIYSCADNKLFEEAVFTNDLLLENLDAPQFRKASTNYLKQTPMILFLREHNDPVGLSFSNEIKKVCDYTKIPFKSYTEKNFNHINLAQLQSAKVIYVSDTRKLSNTAIELIYDFVASGGTLIITQINHDERIRPLIGLNVTDKLTLNKSARGLVLNATYIPNLNAINIENNQVHSGFNSTHFNSDNIEIMANSITDKSYPVITRKEFFNGDVFYVNSYMGISKYVRGLYFSFALKGLEGIPYPVNNISTIFLDDFPAAIFDIKQKPIIDELGVGMVNFVSSVWWPDMKKIAEKYNIPYCTGVTFNYNTNVTAPFLYTDWNRHNKVSLSIAQDVKKHKHELGFHGYNHVSLLQKNWHEENNILQAHNTIKKKWYIDNLGQYPTVYIPPSNLIDSFGIHSLKKSIPSIKYICSNFHGNTATGGNREYDTDTHDASFFNYPRVTDGFYLTNSHKFLKESFYLYTGIWSHFVHPDDVYQVPHEKNKVTAGNYEYRNQYNLGWYGKNKGNNGMYYRFENILKQHQKTYPLNTFVTAEKGGDKVYQWRKSSFNFNRTSSLYQVTNTTNKASEQHWLVFVTTKNHNQLTHYLTNKNIRYSSHKVAAGYIINMHTKHGSIQLPIIKHIKQQNNTVTLQKIKNEVHKIGKQYASTVTTKKPTIEEQCAQLKLKIFNEKKFNSTDWDTYAQLLHWQGTPNVVWTDLNDYYLANTSNKPIEYCTQLAQQTWYPTEHVYEMWLDRRYEISKNDSDFLKKYTSYYSNQVGNAKALTSLAVLAEKDPASEYMENYITKLMYSSVKDKEKLNNISPTHEYAAIADEVSWFYYNNNDLHRAYNWAQYTNKIDMSVKLDWLYQTQQYDKMENLYQNHIDTTPNDYKTKIAMAYIYHSLGEFKKSWLTSTTIPDTVKEKERVKEMLNKDVKYVSKKLQTDLLANHSELFYTKLKDSLIEVNRLATNNYISFDGDIASDRTNTSFFDKVSSYTIKSKKNYSHSVSITNSNIYKLKNNLIEPDNSDRELVGIQYQFGSPEHFKKVNYVVGARVEKDIHTSQYFFKGLIKANYAHNKYFISSQFTAYPVKNGPSFSKNIYRNKLGFYAENWMLNRKITNSFYTEGNYYTDDVYSNANTLKSSYSLMQLYNFNVAPFAEGQASFASINRMNSYPYWVINNRFYGGGGLSLTYGKLNQSKIYLFTDVAYFSDSYTNAFTRFTGNTSIRLLKYFVLKGSYEYYLQSEFYSNRFTFGLSYFVN